MYEEFEEDGWMGRHRSGEDEDGPDEIMENPQEVLSECLIKFATPDYIMEPGIFAQLKRYLQAGGTPEQVINLVSQNYSGVAQMANLLAEWLILAGIRVTEVQKMVENHLKDMILRTLR